MVVFPGIPSPLPVTNMQPALIVRRICVSLCTEMCFNPQTLLLSPQRHLKPVNSQISARGPSQAEGWAVATGSGAGSHSLRGTHSCHTDPATKHKSAQISQLGFLSVCTEGLEKSECQSTRCGANFRAWQKKAEDPSLVLMFAVAR